MGKPHVYGTYAPFKKDDPFKLSDLLKIIAEHHILPLEKQGKVFVGPFQIFVKTDYEEGSVYGPDIGCVGWKAYFSEPNK
jgi:hypothetical protein